MVAYTDPDCLPYAEGGDSVCLNTGTLCEPSTVDCDFAAAVEVKLDEFDEAVELVSNPPMAWIETLVPSSFSVDEINDEPFIFDTVRVDSGNMVNLDANPSGITINQSGLYGIMVYVRATTDTVAAGDYVEFGLTTSAQPAYQNFSLFTPDGTPGSYQAVNLDVVTIAPGCFFSTYYEAGQTVSMLGNANGILGGVVNVFKASMAIFWLGDLP